METPNKETSTDTDDKYCFMMKLDFNNYFHRQKMPWHVERKDDWMALCLRSRYLDRLTQMLETAWHLNQLLMERAEEKEILEPFMKKLVEDRNEDYLEKVKAIERAVEGHPVAHLDVSLWEAGEPLL